MRWVTLVVTVVARLASAGPVEVHAPESIVLGKQPTVELAVVGAAARLVTNAGAIGPLAAGHATWTLPSEVRPQRAIVAALDAQGGVLAWISVPLAAEAHLKVQTEKHASVVVRLGTSELPAVEADDRGVATVTALVPPGVSEAIAIGTGTRGAKTEKHVPLGVSKFARTLALCPPAADRVIAIATNENGTPATQLPTVTTGPAKLEPMHATAPGVFEGKLAFDGDHTTVTAMFAGEPVATCELANPPESPTSAKLVADRTRFVAGDGPLAIRLELVFPGKRRALDTPPELSPELGTLSAPTRDGNAYTATWTIPAAFGGRTHAKLRAKLGTAEASLEIELAAAAPERVVTQPASPLRADGEAQIEIVARVEDRYGNPTQVTSLGARGRGQIAPFAARPDGAYVARYVAPIAYDRGDDTVEIADTSTKLAARLDVPLVPIPHALSLAASLGYVSNFARVGAPVVTVAPALRLPWLERRLWIGAQLAAYVASFDAPAMNETVTARVSAVPLLARAGFAQAFGDVELWAGAGAGGVEASARVASPSTGTQTASQLAFGASAFAGGGMRIGPGALIVEVGYLHARVATPALSGAIGGLLATVGFAIAR